MAHELDDLAGESFDRSGEEARQACLAELKPVIARLQCQGVPIGVIIAALACAVIDITDLFRRH